MNISVTVQDIDYFSMNGEQEVVCYVTSLLSSKSQNLLLTNQI